MTASLFLDPADNEIKVTREWCMPTKDTFTMPVVRRLFKKYNVGKGWIDPFAGDYSPAEFTNDLNPEKRAASHMHALDFVKRQEREFIGVLFDPPYSPRQMKEVYESIGIHFNKKNGQEAPHFADVKSAISGLVTGFAISFGWNSTGFGISRGFKIVEIILINHGGNGHNDTIVTIEKKI